MNERTHHADVTVSENGTIVIENTPFQEGEKVVVTIANRGATRGVSEDDRYPLRGTVYEYIDPFSSVAEDDWEVLQ